VEKVQVNSHSFTCPPALKYKFNHPVEALKLHTRCTRQLIGTIKAPAQGFKHLTWPLAGLSSFHGGKSISEFSFLHLPAGLKIQV
jgi:hypothetical protein